MPEYLPDNFIPPVYHSFNSRGEVWIWAMGFAVFLGVILTPILLNNPHLFDLLIVSVGAFALGRYAREAVNGVRFNKALKEITRG